MESVLKNGPKWSFISKSILHDRTEHNIKNRFFSLVSGFSGVPIKLTIKERKKYINEEYVNEVLMFYYNNMEMEKKIIKKTEFQKEESSYQVEKSFKISRNTQTEHHFVINDENDIGRFMNLLENQP